MLYSINVVYFALLHSNFKEKIKNGSISLDLKKENYVNLISLVKDAVYKSKLGY